MDHDGWLSVEDKRAENMAKGATSPRLRASDFAVPYKLY